MSRSLRRSEERDGTDVAPSAPCALPGSALPGSALPGSALTPRADRYRCTTPVCHRGRSTSTLRKGCCRKKRPNKKTVDHARYDTEKERFSHKCSELRRYLAPLASILRGLRSGRYSGRLSSFQERLATDRLQRILGVLQSPRPEGRFLSAVLKIEEMLQSWFPHVQDSSDCERQKWLYCDVACPRPPSVGPAPQAMQDNAVSSSSDIHAVPPRDRAARSPCLERLLQAKESIVQSRAEARPDVNPD